MQTDRIDTASDHEIVMNEVTSYYYQTAHGSRVLVSLFL